MKFLGTAPRVEKTTKDLTEEETKKLDDLQSLLENTDNPAEKTEIAKKIGRIYVGEYDKKSQRLREEVTRMVGDFVSGKLTPIVLTNRSEILGMPREEYFANRQKNLKARKLRR